MTRAGRRLIEDFLLPALNEQRYGERLKWDDKEKMYFTIRWSHKNAAKWSLEDTVVFQDWDKLKGHFHPENKGYYMQAKQRFRAALYKLNTVKKLKSEDKHVKKYQLVLNNDKKRHAYYSGKVRIKKEFLETETGQRYIPTPVICSNAGYVEKKSSSVIQCSSPTLSIKSEVSSHSEDASMNDNLSHPCDNRHTLRLSPELKCNDNALRHSPEPMFNDSVLRHSPEPKFNGNTFRRLEPVFNSNTIRRLEPKLNALELKFSANTYRHSPEPKCNISMTNDRVLPDHVIVKKERKPFVETKFPVYSSLKIPEMPYRHLPIQSMPEYPKGRLLQPRHRNGHCSTNNVLFQHNERSPPNVIKNGYMTDVTDYMETPDGVLNLSVKSERYRRESFSHSNS